MPDKPPTSPQEETPFAIGNDQDAVPAGSQGASDPGVTGEADESRAAELEQARRERDEQYDRLLRKTAEFENYRKRVEKERREAARYAASDLLEELLPIIDNFERALQVDAAADPEAYRKGVELINKQLLDLLARRGVTSVEPVGQDFDPRFHQAITHEESPGHRDGEVIEEVRRGYMHGDRLLRPAMVKVAKA